MRAIETRTKEIDKKVKVDNALQFTSFHSNKVKFCPKAAKQLKGTGYFHGKQIQNSY